MRRITSSPEHTASSHPYCVSTVPCLEVTSLINSCCVYAPAVRVCHYRLMSRSVALSRCLIGWSLSVIGCEANLGGETPDLGETELGPDGQPTLGGAEPATDPGRVTLHRLNRSEYNNTVQDLMGTSERPADEFPIDDRGKGFDSIADVLTLSPLHLDLMYSAVESVIQTALGSAGQRENLITCDLVTGGEDCLRTSLSNFAAQAWRRPPTEAEVERLLAVAQIALDAGDEPEVGLELALRAVLLSPHFLFRVELDPNPTSLTPHPVGPYELASRLSYFLWSSMPDDELFAAASTGEITQPEVVSTHVERMLEDERAAALVDNFAGQWLGLRALEGLIPDADLFPDFDEPLRAAMFEETALMFREVAFNNLPVDEFLVADFTFANDRLATHYGLAAVGSDEFTRVELLGNAERGGFLSHASLLALTSHPDRTSVVNRGKWIMAELLCTDVPAPPADVSTDAGEQAAEEGLTQREALELHRADPSCNGCHEMMDPIGFGLENYDAIGAFRTVDASGDAIDSGGVLPDGSVFSGAGDLATLIASDPAFAKCLTEKLYTFALGRTPVRTATHMDTQVITRLSSGFAENFAFQELIVAIATSETFMNRRGDESEGGNQ